MKKTIRFVGFGAAIALQLVCPALAEDNCPAISSSLRQAIESKPSDVLQLVESQISSSPACSCEIVKTAVEVTQADSKTVASIVEVAATAAPDKMRLIAQCAVAVAPDALADVQAVLAKLDPSTGKASNSSKDSKDAKDAKEPQVADTWNPLDFPGDKDTPPPPVEHPKGPGPGTEFPPVITPPATRTDFKKL